MQNGMSFGKGSLLHNNFVSLQDCCQFSGFMFSWSCLIAGLLLPHVLAWLFMQLIQSGPSIFVGFHTLKAFVHLLGFMGKLTVKERVNNPLKSVHIHIKHPSSLKFFIVSCH